jgi:4-diphosphocytidyl-2-C-methyl-D-erythritol kinase
MADSPDESGAGGSAFEIARAKINLTLDVLGRLPNGYHALRSLVGFASVGDRLFEVPTDGGSQAPLVGAWRLEVMGPFGAALVGENLISRAAELVAEAWPEAVIPSIRLEKNLPVAAGIGGGSADAAAFLRLTRRRNPGLGTDADWFEIAGRLGADVPVCIASQPTIMSGTGDVFTAIAFPRALPAVLVNPLSAVPPSKTRDVFRALGAPEIAAIPDVDAGPANGRAVADMIEAGSNDLLDAAKVVVPEIGAVLAALTAAAPDASVRLSGAGPTCFALVQCHQTARATARHIAEAHPGWWVRATEIGPAIVAR